MRTLLAVAAEEFELKWIRRRMAGRKDVRLIAVANGPGPRLAGMAADSVRIDVDAVVSTGLCGALDDRLKIGDIFIAGTVNGLEARMPPSVSQYGTGRYITGPLVSIDRVAGTVEEKRRLRAAGAWAVEMEAAAVIERARRWGKPFYCIRAVSDAADEGFVLDLNAARDAEGRFRLSSILGQALRQPGRILPELLRLRRNSDLAARALGDFFANCRF